jgi:hypothetical protein
MKLLPLSEVLNRDITFLSGFFAASAAKCLHSSVAPGGPDTVKSAFTLTFLVIAFYVIVSIYFVNAKKKADNAQSGDAVASDFQQGISDSVDHITGSLGWCVALAWYGLAPDGYYKGPWAVTGVLVVAILILIILEFIYRKTKKGTVAYHVMSLVQECAQGAFAWHIANTLNLKYKDWYDVPPNPLEFTMYLMTVFVGTFHMEIINCIAARFAQHEDATELAYGNSIMTMWKATPIKSSHLMLRDFVEGRWAPDLFGACAAWTAIALPLVATLHLLRQAMPGCGLKKDVADKYAVSSVSIVSHSIAWVCGQLFGDAYVAWLTATNYYVTAPFSAQHLMFFVVGFICLIISLVLAQTRLSGITERCCPAGTEDEEDEYEDDEEQFAAE